MNTLPSRTVHPAIHSHYQVTELSLLNCLLGSVMTKFDSPNRHKKTLIPFSLFTMHISGISFYHYYSFKHLLNMIRAIV